MAKYLKWTAVVVVGLVLGAVLYFALTPKTEKAEFAFIDAPESHAYSTSTPLENEVYFVDDAGVMFSAGGGDVDDGWKYQDWFKDDVIIYEVICVNFLNKESFTEATYDSVRQKLEDIANFFWEESKHQLQMKFNLFISNCGQSERDVVNHRCDYMYEATFYDRCKKMAHTKLNDNGDPDARILLFSELNSQKQKTTSWPHIYYPQSAKPIAVLSLNNNTATFRHELYHTLGLPDLYSNTGIFGLNNFVGLTDVMSNSNLTQTSAYFKSKLGWFETSSFDDGVTTDIETISQTGTYTLDLPSTIGGISAYKFGEYGSQYFLAEQRTFPDGARFLIVQRINEQLHSNINAKSSNEALILSFGASPYHYDGNSCLLSSGDVVGNANNPLYYVLEKRANFCITNIRKAGDTKISFDFYNYENSTEFDNNQENLDNSDKNSADAVGEASAGMSSEIYVNVLMQNGTFAPASKISLYDSTTKKYTEVKTVSLVYINGVAYYRITGVLPKHTKCQVGVSQYRVYEIAETTLEEGKRVYTITTNRNILHDIGDFINDIGETFVELYHTLFRRLSS
ncbi:MAG: hypothetical protein IKT27_04975 [Clostridia bacterium]|nr:hypothetical protein [Clostridia bacterium]